MSTPATPDRRDKGCPLCGKRSSAEHKPFCSRGCRDRDLLNWLGASYRGPGPPAVENPEGGLDSEG
jgi:endogenous inhibitor of DNA gyrase (YacG/DUF329 family)